MILKNQKLPEKNGSHIKIKIVCDECKKEQYREFRYILRQREKYGEEKDYCQKCAHLKMMSSDEYLKKLRSSVKKGSDHPNFGKKFPKISERMKKNNPMKNAETRKKVSEFRLNMPKEMREKYAAGSRKAWAEGKHDGTAVGKCKWYSYTKKRWNNN